MSVSGAVAAGADVHLPPGTARLLEESFARVVSWVKSHHYRAYEPADGNSSILFPLTGGRVFPMRILQQVVLRAPWNIRPVIGVRAHESAIGRGYMGWAFVRTYERTRDEGMRADAIACFEWLMKNRAGGYEELCWGDPYEYATRSGRRPHGEPLLIWSSLIGLALLDAFRILRDERYLDAARSVGRWVLALPAERTERGICLSYVTYRQSSIHNANAMGAAFLARLGSVIGDEQHLATARQAMLYTCARQLPDGSWFYAEEPKYHWIDNFHTGYNLSALKVYRDSTREDVFDGQLQSGLEYFRTMFFDSDGRPKYFDNSLYPVDIQCAAQAIETLASLSDGDPICLTQALTIARWTIENLQASDGHFLYRDLGWTKVRTPMLHWGQGTMAKALAIALEKVNTHA